MNKVLLAVVLACALSPGAHATPPIQPAGRPCWANAAEDRTREPGWEVGDIRGGPLVTLEDGTLNCSLHVNNNTHSAPAVVSVNYDATAGLVVAGAPEVFHFQMSFADDFWVCATWYGASRTLYWVSPDLRDPTDQGHWDTDPNAECAFSLGETYDPECRVWLAVDQRLGTNIAEIWQDCEGYEPII